MINPLHILEGWSNFIDKSEVTEAVAKERAEICAVCQFAKKGKLLVFLNDNLKNINGFRCDKCGCPLSAKVRSMASSCPDKKW